MRPLRYVILWHDGIDEPHFDIMVETYPGSMLTTWRSPRWPIDRATLATRLKDHRREFLDFEGELTGRRGRVTRVAAGTCTVEIGEAGAWIVQVLSGASPQKIRLKSLTPERWEITEVA